MMSPYFHIHQAARHEVQREGEKDKSSLTCIHLGETGRSSSFVPYKGYGDYEFRIWRGENMSFDEFCDLLGGRYDFRPEDKKLY